MGNQQTTVLGNSSSVVSSSASASASTSESTSAYGNHDVTAAVSPSTLPSTPYSRYDVFINHRGPDVKSGLATSIYNRLISKGYQVFLDKPELEEGYPITSQIEAAIQVASIHIAIFSPTYAESNWCLDELVLMIESKATILPVFYKVAPSVVRFAGKNGAYAEALRKLRQKTTDDSGKTKPRYTSETIEKWINALNRVSYTSGFELEEGGEDDLLNNIVQGVLKKLPKQPLDVARYPTGLEEKLNEFETRVLSCVGVNKVVGIVGAGGVGKTTLAKHFFNLNRSNYSESSFLFDVRQKTGTVSLNALQRSLLMDLKHKDFEIENRDRGIKILQDQLQSCRVIIVLDDVDDATQLEAFLPVRDSLSFDSLILITSRDKHLLISSGVLESSIYNLDGLSKPFSNKLFCSYAFSRPDPPKEFAELVDQFITACDGLPLSLKVFGALVCGRDNTYWEEILETLSQTLPTEIETRLRISYESLTKEDKPTFLDIACFFIEEDRDTVIKVLGVTGLQNLEDKCMLEVDSKRKIKMHDHIRDMGRNIAKEGSMPRRLYPMTNSIDDLSGQWSSVTKEEVRGIRTVSSIDDFFQSLDRFSPVSMTTTVRDTWYKRWSHEMSRNPINNLQFHGMGKLQFVATQGHYLEGMLRGEQSPHLKWLRWYRCPHSSLPSWIPMKNLRVLDVEGDGLNTLWPDESPVPVELRALNIWAPISDFPRSIGQLCKLEKLIIYNDPEIQSRSKLASFQTLPDEFCDLRSLKYLELKFCVHIRKLPDSFGKLSSLQYMVLQGAWSLKTLPNSFGELPRLKHFSLSYCPILTISNGTLQNISTLETLDVSFCSNVKELPTRIGDLCKLEALKLERDSLELLPPSFVELCMLKDLSIRASPKLKCLPESFALLSQLTELSLWECGIEYLPQDLPKMNNLQILKVSGCPLRELPFSKVEGARETQGRALNKLEQSNDKLMFGLKHLELDRTDISEIAFLPDFCPDLTTLEVRGCFKLKSVQGLENLSKLLKIDIVFCPAIEELELGGMEYLKELRVFRCQKLKSIKGLGQATKLLKLAINECHEIEELIDVKLLISLEEFNAHACKKLTSIQGLEDLTKLQILDVSQCRGIQNLPIMDHLISLKKLDVSGCWKLKRIQGLRQLTKFQILNVAFCYELRQLQGVEHSKSLEELDARNCPKLQWGGRAVLELLHEQLKERLIL